jgi:hypothetical protein
MKAPKDLLDLLKPYPRAIQEMTLALRELIVEEMAPCCEYILEVYTIAMHYGPTHNTMKDGICYIALTKDHINLGFLRGSELADTHRILEGTGKQMRHIKIKTMDHLERPAIRAYIQEACERAGYEFRTDEAKTVSTIVKRKSLPRSEPRITRI